MSGWVIKRVTVEYENGAELKMIHTGDGVYEYRNGDRWRESRVRWGLLLRSDCCVIFHSDRRVIEDSGGVKLGELPLHSMTFDKLEHALAWRRAHGWASDIFEPYCFVAIGHDLGAGPGDEPETVYVTDEEE